MFLKFSVYIQLAIIAIVMLGNAAKTLGQESPPVISCEPTLDSVLLNNKLNDPPNNIIKANNISETGLTIPSLWWTKEQFDPFGGKMVENWLAYKDEKRIDLIVNAQLWSILDYLDRYRFVDNFGNAARHYGYNLRIFNRQKNCLALYFYNPNVDPPRWEITFNNYLQTGFEINQ